MKSLRTAGILMITGAMGVLVPYTILTITFSYPDILREDAGVILHEFHKAGPGLIFTWLAFALLGLPLLVAYKLTGQQLENKIHYMGWTTTIGTISIVVQLIGLLRWVFVVPVLANEYHATHDPVVQSSLKSIFRVVHQYGGVLLGEHIGQLFTITWTIMTSLALKKSKLIPQWISHFGIAASVIYFIAQAELLATVIPGFPVWDMAGFTGSTVWLLWLIIIGLYLIRKTGFKKHESV